MSSRFAFKQYISTNREDDPYDLGGLLQSNGGATAPARIEDHGELESQAVRT